MNPVSHLGATCIDPSNPNWKLEPCSRGDPSSVSWIHVNSNRPSPDSSRWVAAKGLVPASITPAPESPRGGRTSSETTIAIAIVIALCLTVPCALGTSNLKKGLMGRRWESVRSSAILEMNFKSSQIGFTAWSAFWEQNLGSFDYAVICPWGFIANTADGWKYYKAELDGTMLIVSPAMTGNESSEIWVGID